MLFDAGLVPFSAKNRVQEWEAKRGEIAGLSGRGIDRSSAVQQSRRAGPPVHALIPWIASRWGRTLDRAAKKFTQRKVRGLIEVQHRR